MIDQVGDLTLMSVGQGYDDGYDLELLAQYVTKRVEQLLMIK